MANAERPARFLRRVATDHRLARLMRRRIVELLPEEHVVRLFMKRKMRMQIPVHEDMGWGFEKVATLIRKELPVGIMNIGEIAPSVAFGIRVERFLTTAEEPTVCERAILASFEHHEFMVAP